VFLSGVPAASLEAMRIGMEDVGITACHQVGILDRLSQVDAPPAMEFISLSEREFNTIHANDVSFFDEGRTSSQRRELVTLRAGHPLKPWFLILNVRQSGLA
jgi:hypothetical protein